MTYPPTRADRYYTAARSGQRTALLSGPWPNHGDAAGDLDRVRRIVREKYSGDMDATFADFGVAHVRGGAIRRTALGMPEQMGAAA